MFTEGDGGAVEEWRRMILNAPIVEHPELNEKLWLNLGTIRIAVHVRGGIYYQVFEMMYGLMMNKSYR